MWQKESTLYVSLTLIVLSSLPLNSFCPFGLIDILTTSSEWPMRTHTSLTLITVNHTSTPRNVGIGNGKTARHLILLIRIAACFFLSRAFVERALARICF